MEGTYQIWTSYFGDGESQDGMSPLTTITVGRAVAVAAAVAVAEVAPHRAMSPLAAP